MEFFFDDQEQSSLSNSRKSSGNLFGQDHYFSTNRTPKQSIVPSEISRPREGSLVTRKSVVVSPSEVEFIDGPKPRKSLVRKQNPALTYSRKKRKLGHFFKELTLGKVGWIICVLLTLRLVFMERGIIDYYRQEGVLQDQKRNLEMLYTENVNLNTEIHQIKTNEAYQKKMARDHLGVIAKDEFLILFAKDSIPLTSH